MVPKVNMKTSFEAKASFAYNFLQASSNFNLQTIFIAISPYTYFQPKIRATKLKIGAKVFLT